MAARVGVHPAREVDARASRTRSRGPRGSSGPAGSGSGRPRRGASTRDHQVGALDAAGSVSTEWSSASQAIGAVILASEPSALTISAPPSAARLQVRALAAGRARQRNVSGLAGERSCAPRSTPCGSGVTTRSVSGVASAKNALSWRATPVTFSVPTGLTPRSMSGRCRPSLACASIVRSTSGASGANAVAVAAQREVDRRRPVLACAAAAGSPGTGRACPRPDRSARRGHRSTARRARRPAGSATGSARWRSSGKRSCASSTASPRLRLAVRAARRAARRRAHDRRSAGRCVCSTSRRRRGRRVSASGAVAPPPVRRPHAAGAANAPVIRHPARTNRHGDPRTVAISYLPETQRNRTSAETAPPARPTNLKGQTL